MLRVQTLVLILDWQALYCDSSSSRAEAVLTPHLPLTLLVSSFMDSVTHPGFFQEWCAGAFSPLHPEYSNYDPNDGRCDPAYVVL